jgi:hypothetical protein
VDPSLHPFDATFTSIHPERGCKVSGGESRVSRRVGLLRNPHAPPLEVPKMGSLHFWWPFRDSCCIALVELPVSYLEFTVPAAACEMVIVFGSASCACFACRVLSI